MTEDQQIEVVAQALAKVEGHAWAPRFVAEYGDEYRCSAKAAIAALQPADLLTRLRAMPEPGPEAMWPIGQRVRKIKGSSWQGKIVGYYSTSLTNEGYCIESEREPGSVQIFPRAALELVESDT